MSGWQGDFDTAEGGGVITGPIRARLREKTFSLNAAWGYTPEVQVMSWEQVVRLLVDAVVRNGAVLANVGPDKDGVILPKQAATLRGVGQWLKRYGTAVYGTRPGPYQPADGVFGSTQRADSIFIHVLCWPENELALPTLGGKIAHVRNLSGDTVHRRADDNNLNLTVPTSDRGLPVAVIEVTRA